MEAILGLLQEFVSLGVAIFLPVIMVILGGLFGMRLGHATKSRLLVGIGFQGLTLAISLLIATIRSVMDYYRALGSGYDALGVGFATLGTASWTVSFAVFVISAIVIMSLILVRLKITKVLNVDIWNLMHFLVSGALVHALSGNAVINFLIVMGCGIVTLFFSQWLVPKQGEFFGLEGTTRIALAFCARAYPIAYGFNRTIDLIPGLRDVDVNMDKLERKLGIFGDLAVVELLVGVLPTLLTRQDLGALLTIGMGVVVPMVLIPRMVSIMMEGLTPMGSVVDDYMHRKIGDDAGICIGMDIALGLEGPACITYSAIMMPVTVLLAFLIPDIRFFPLGILAEVCYLAPMCALTNKGNIFRTLICMTVMMFIALFFTNMFIPEAAQILSVAGAKFEGLVTISYSGWNPGNLLVSLLHRLFGMPG